MYLHILYEISKWLSDIPNLFYIFFKILQNIKNLPRLFVKLEMLKAVLILFYK